MGIRLTFVSNNVRGVPTVYDTDSLREAVHEFADGNLRGDHPDSNGPEKWVMAIVIEQGDARFDGDELAATFRNIASIERVRAERH